MARTTHFFLYALPRLPSEAQVGRQRGEKTPVDPRAVTAPAGLSTGQAPCPLPDVDDLGAIGLCRFGLVLPKKQARRSVTRSLIRHQAREALRRHAPALAAQARFGASLDAWVLRLRAPFDRQLFPSAASPALNAAVRLELDELWGRLASDPARAQA